MPNQGISCILAALLVWGLASCSSNPPAPPPESAAPDALSEAALADRIRTLIDRARASQSPERERFLLQAGELLVTQQEYERAHNLLTSIDSRRLDYDAFLKHSRLLGQVALAEGAYSLAERILTNARLERQWQTMPPEREVALRRLRARLFDLQGEVEASLTERALLGSLLTDPDDETRNREALWQTLMALPLDQLRLGAETTAQRQLRGWYQLAAVSKDNQTDLERQQARVDEWRSQWSDHPANLHLPEDLQLLRALIENQPRQLALLLPTQGNLANAANAVRDGFLAAYYQAQSNQSRVPHIRLYDSSGVDIQSLYRQAVAEGAELIIGPLDKDKVQQLYEGGTLTVPVLTLNYTERAETTAPGEEDPEAPKWLYQFGLAADDEARQVARRAFRDSHRRAMVLTPDRNWSRRSARAFSREWQTLEGEVLVDSQFTSAGDYSPVIQSALLIDQSQSRRQALQQLLGEPLEFEPRRRKDLDMIFLIANPEQGRQINPTLAFHYASDLPVYATSHIYTGAADSKSDRDLNGVRFNTMPWLLNGQYPEKTLLEEHARVSAIYSRLHALGVDAFRLYPRLPQLERVPQARLYGATGALRMRPGGLLEREQVWAHFQGGQVLPLSGAATTRDTPEEQGDALDIWPVILEGETRPDNVEKVDTF